MKNRDLKIVVFLIIAVTTAVLFWRKNHAKKTFAPAVSSSNHPKRSTASVVNLKTPNVDAAKTPSIVAPKKTDSLVKQLSLEDEIAALPTVKKKRFIAPHVTANFIGFVAATRNLTSKLSKSVPEEPPLDREGVAKYSHAVERYFNDNGWQSPLPSFPYISSTETGELLKLYCVLEAIPYEERTEIVNELRFKIQQQLVGSSQDTYQEILRSVDRVSDFPKIEEVHMILTSQLTVSKSEKVHYFNIIFSRQHHQDNAAKAQQFLKNLSQETD